MFPSHDQGYNSNPPSDDGSNTDENEITWAGIKSKLGDPLKTLLESVNTKVDTFADSLFGKAVTEISTATNLASGDYGKLIVSTGTTTLTLLEGASAGSNFIFQFRNNDASATMTLDRNSMNINGAAADFTVLPGESGIAQCDGTNWWINLSRTTTDLNAVPKGYLSGLEMSNDTDTEHDILIAAGIARDSANGANLELTTATTKQIDNTFSAGDDAGGMFTGSVATDTWYHVFLIKKDSDGTIDAGFDTSISAANIPSGYTEYRRIGSVLTDGSSNILGFKQVGDDFVWTTSVTDSTTSFGTSEASVTISTPLGVPVMATLVVHGQISPSSGWQARVYSPYSSDETITQSNATIAAATATDTDSPARS